MSIYLFPQKNSTQTYKKVIRLIPIDEPTATPPVVPPNTPQGVPQEQDGANAPLSAFLTATPFHTQETIETLKKAPYPEKKAPTKRKTIDIIARLPTLVSSPDTDTTAPQAASTSDIPEATTPEEKALFSRIGSAFSRDATLPNDQHPRYQIIEIPIQNISANPSQPRKIFEQEHIEELANSIKQHGILHPLLVKPSEEIENCFTLIAGERRLRAAQILDIYAVPCIIMHTSAEKSAEIALIENLQRRDLNFFEQAYAIQALLTLQNCTQEEIAAKLGYSQSYIANKLRILQFSAEEQAIILQNNLTERHARALLQEKDPSRRQELLEKVIKNHWTVAQTENEIAKTARESNESDEQQRRKGLPQDHYLRILERAVTKLRLNGGNISCERREDDKETQWIIRVPR